MLHAALPLADPLDFRFELLALKESHKNGFVHHFSLRTNWKAFDHH